MLTLIAAVASNRVIGLNNQMPWHLPEDLQRFKQLTMNKPMIMGRKTFESLGRVLPGRPHIVISRNSAYELPAGGQCHLANSLEQALEIAGTLGAAEAMVIGGEAIFSESLPVADRLLLTEIECAPEGDTWFPPFNSDQWVEVASEAHNGSIPFRFVEYRRRALSEPNLSCKE
jgi:dihydrofolate reductase